MISEIKTNKEDFPYLIDNIPVTWRQLIREAQKLGLYIPDGLYTTSAAAEYLRAKGFTVENNE